MAGTAGLTVAVTGPTGTFGRALVPLLQQDDRVARVIGIARRPFDPAAHGWTKMEYRRGDVRDADALGAAFEGADVVVHLAFLIVGGSAETTRAINVEGTLNAFRAAAGAGARRFVYASSIAAYGFHRDNPIGMDEDWATRPADRLFYAREKAELEHLLQRGGRPAPGDGAVPAAAPDRPRPRRGRRQGEPPRRARAPGARRGGGAAAASRAAGPRAGPPPPAHPPGGRGRGAAPVRRRRGSARRLQHRRGRRRHRRRRGPRARARRGAGPGRSRRRRGAGWPRGCRTCRRRPSGSRRVSHPAIMDTTKARTQLGWQPRHTAIESLRSTLDRVSEPPASSTSAQAARATRVPTSSPTPKRCHPGAAHSTQTTRPATMPATATPSSRSLTQAIETKVPARSPHSRPATGPAGRLPTTRIDCLMRPLSPTRGARGRGRGWTGADPDGGRRPVGGCWTSQPDQTHGGPP